MKAEAEANAEADKKAKDEIEKVNAADSMIFQSEKNLKDYGDKLPADKKSAIESALADLKSAHASKNIPAIDSAMEKINAAWQAASEDMYKAQQQGGANPGAGAGLDPNNMGGQQGNPNASQQNGNDETVTDADFEEVK